MPRFKIPVGVKIFVAIWALALCVPTVREFPRSFAFYDLNSDEKLLYPSSLIQPRDAADAVGAAWQAERATGDNDKAAALQAVAARFPDNLPIRALVLRVRARDLTLDKARASGDAAANGLFVETAQLAHQGALAEPDNTFWPWMESVFWFAARRDDAALAAWKRAGQGTRYQDYQMKTVAARLAWLQQRRAVPWEERLSLLLRTDASELVAARQAAKLAATHARQLRARGDASDALKLEADILSAASTMRQSGAMLYTALSGEAVARSSLEIFAGVPPQKQTSDFQNSPVNSAALVRDWRVYARQNGRAHLAARADFVDQPSVIAIANDPNNYPLLSQFGMSTSQIVVAAFAPTALMLLALLIGAGALIWLAGAALNLDSATPTRGQIVACVNFSFWLILGVILLSCVAYSYLFNAFWGRPPGSEIDPNLAPIFLSGFGLLTTLCWILPVGYVSWRRGRKWILVRPAAARPLPRLWNGARLVLWLIFLVSLGVTLYQGSDLWNGAWFELSNAALVADASLICVVALELTRWFLGGKRLKSSPHRAGERPKAGLNFWAPLGAWFLCALFLALAAFNLAQGTALSESIVPLFLAIVAAAGGLILGWRATSDRFGWHLAHRSVGVLMITGSLIFLLIALVAWPIRAQLNSNLDRQIQIGEIAWMREQIAK